MLDCDPKKLISKIMRPYASNLSPYLYYYFRKKCSEVRKSYKNIILLLRAKFGAPILKFGNPKKGRDPQFEKRCFTPIKLDLGKK